MLVTIIIPALLAAAVASAQEPTVILADHESVAPSTQELQFTVPDFSIEHQVRLSLLARIDFKSLAGSNPWLRVAANGTFLTKPDLLNKTHEFKLKRGLDLTWSAGDRWRLLYSPDFEAAVTNVEDVNSCPDADPYHFVWDITPYVQPGENTLTLEHLHILVEPSTIVLKDISVEVGRAISSPEEPTAPAPVGPLPAFVGGGAKDVPIQATLNPSGALRVEAGGRTFDFTTRVGLPGGEWHATENSDEDSGASVTWSAGACEFERTISVRPDHVHVADTLTNTSAELLGVILEHNTSLADAPDGVRVCGREAFSDTMELRNSYHPSVFAKWADAGLGIIAEDDILRVHNVSSIDPKAMGIGDDRLGIDAGASVTLEWSVYPVPGGDYWDFVNAVRRNWDSNFTIPGPFVFGGPYPEGESDEWYGNWVRERNMKIVAGNIAKYPDGKYAHGTGMLFAPEWVAREAEWVQGMQAGAPEVDVVAYLHAQCSTEPDAPTKYADSLLIDSTGKHLTYPYRYPLPLYLPTRDNAYGKALWGFVNGLLDDVGVSGIYWDEMSYSVLQYAYDTTWDGCTVSIDRATHEVTGKLTSVALATQSLKLDIVKHVRDRGLFLMANGQPMTRTMHAQKIVRFVETGTYSAMINTHLACPLGLGNHHTDNSQADVATHVRRLLEHGGLHYGHYFRHEPEDWHFQSIMYPITPVEIREGMVLGQERIHTARSGRFSFPDGSPAEVYVVDADGARVEGGMVEESVDGGRRTYEIRMPGDHFAILTQQDQMTNSLRRGSVSMPSSRRARNRL